MKVPLIIGSSWPAPLNESCRLLNSSIVRRGPLLGLVLPILTAMRFSSIVVKFWINLSAVNLLFVASASQPSILNASTTRFNVFQNTKVDRNGSYFAIAWTTCDMVSSMGALYPSLAIIPRDSCFLIFICTMLESLCSTRPLMSAWQDSKV